jgi:hypothetical protein
MIVRSSLKRIAALAFLVGTSSATAVPLEFSAAGAAPANIQATVDAFRVALGAQNANVAGSFGSGRREINWDGVPDAFAAPNNLPADFFNTASPRGVVFSTPGGAVQVSANAGVAPVEFGTIDPNYPAVFASFSAQRLFTAIGSNIVDVSFFVPGSNTAALTRGFGAVFSDVDLANTSRIEYFDAASQSLGSYSVQNVGGSETLSFLGVVFDGNAVARVRITAGNQVLLPGNTLTDLAVMDDFIYGEPIARVVPEPASLLLLSAGLLAIARRRR